MVRQLSRASDGQGYKWHTSTKEYLRTDLDALVSSPPTNEKVALLLQSLLQDEEDTVVKRSSLPNDESTKNTDPKRDNIFWQGGNIVTRANIVTVTVVDGELLVSVRVA